jgi:hypothetical protein
MHGICKPFQSKFSCATFKFSLCDTVFSSWGRSGQIFYLPYCLFQKKREKKKKGTPPWYMNVGGHPMESVSHGLRKEKKGGEECQAL